MIHWPLWFSSEILLYWWLALGRAGGSTIFRELTWQIKNLGRVRMQEWNSLRLKGFLTGMHTWPRQCVSFQDAKIFSSSTSPSVSATVYCVVLAFFQVFRTETSDCVPSCEHTSPRKNYCMFLLSSALGNLLSLLLGLGKIKPKTAVTAYVLTSWAGDREGRFTLRLCRDGLHNCLETQCCEI